MEQYSVIGFPEILTSSTQFKKLNTRASKLLLLDRCNWMLSSIIRLGIALKNNHKGFINLNSQNIIKVLGERNYKDIQLCLVGLGMIVVNPKYSTGSFTKSFKLTDKAIMLGIESAPIYTEKFRLKLDKRLREKLEEAKENPVYKKLLENTLKLKVVEEAFYYAERLLPDQEYIETDVGLINVAVVNKFKANRYDVFYNSFTQLNNTKELEELIKSPVFMFPSTAKSGRVYHLAAFMPKLIRESIRTKSNELLWEVDMSSAQPSILFLEWIKHTANKKSLNEEQELCLKLVLNGGIYNYIKENSNYFKELPYKKLKQVILSAINAENKPTQPNKELSRLFSGFMTWINDIKSKNYKKVSFLGQSTEAKIFVEVYKSLPNEKFALLIHDCVLTNKEDAVIVKQLLEKKIRELYKNIILPKHNLDKLFKVSLVSIIDENLIKTERDKASKEFYYDTLDLFEEDDYLDFI